jgi:hypothetical protein
VLVREKRFEAIAEMLARITRDAAFRAAILRGQRDRLSAYRQRDLSAELRQHLSPLLHQP